jgi:hypothetical protein
LDDLGQSPLYSNNSEEQVFLAQDEFRQRQIQQENEMAEAGLQTLSNNPAWNDIQAKVCALNATALKRPFSGNIHSERKWAFERFDKNAKLYLRTVTDTPTADAFCGILPILARVAFWECRMGRPPQYCLSVSADAVSFEIEVAAQIELAKMRAYEKSSKRTNMNIKKAAGTDKFPGGRPQLRRKATPRTRDWPEALSEDDPNYELAKRFYLQTWSDSHGLVAEGFAGRLTLPDFLEGCANTFSQSAATHVQFKDTTPIQAKCKELDRMADLHIRKLKNEFAAAPRRLRKPLAAALEEYSRKVNEIASRSKQQLFQEELIATQRAQPVSRMDLPQDISRKSPAERTSPKELVDAAKRHPKRSYEKFASRIGIGKDTLYAVTKEKRWVSDESYMLVAEACNCRPEDLHPRDIPRPERRRG